MILFIKQQCGEKPFYLWCLARNPTCGFYEHMGGCKIAQKEAQIGSEVLQEICYLFE